MKGMNAVRAASAALLAVLTLQACDRASGDAAKAPPAEAGAAAPSPDPVPRTTTAAGPSRAPAKTTPAADGAPAYAVIPSGAVSDGPATQVVDATGAGGLLTYSTDMAPDAVIEFHRGQAEGAGLVTMATMTQGGTRSYAASDPRRPDKMVQVVASPVPGDADRPQTSVQLTWTAAD